MQDLVKELEIIIKNYVKKQDFNLHYLSKDKSCMITMEFHIYEKKWCIVCNDACSGDFYYCLCYETFYDCLEAFDNKCGTDYCLDYVKKEFDI